jgi:carbamoyltransferase
MLDARLTAPSNGRHYNLISRSIAKTGIPVVLNTSFNQNEPIVCTPKEAVDCFCRARMDVLVIG